MSEYDEVAKLLWAVLIGAAVLVAAIGFGIGWAAKWLIG